jgi:putative membrane protein insertion efficiency factor
VKTILIGLVTAYRRFVSPLHPPVCKFYPSCSAYTLQALQVHGALRGVWLGIRRLARCHPWSLGGYDPVPGTPAAAEYAAELADKELAVAGRRNK